MGDSIVPNQQDKVLVGSRKSELALVQTREVISMLKKLYPSKNFDIVSMDTIGDKVLDKPLPKIGEKSLFTKELETLLGEKKIQLVVHSMKDLPTALPDGMTVGAVLEREDPKDAVVLNEKFKHLKDPDLSSLPKDSVIGTSSLRRVAQLNEKFPHLKIESIRGNLSTRLHKLDNGSYSGIILAVAGLNRMGLESRISKVLDEKDMMYAVGQGALAVECRDDDIHTLQMLEPLHHSDTTIRIIAERSFLSTLEGGCSAPVGVSSKYFTEDETGEERLELEGGVWSLDGKKVLKKKDSCILPKQVDCEEQNHKKSIRVFCGISTPSSIVGRCSVAHKLGQKLANSLLKDGASEIMKEARKQNEAH